MSKSLQDQLLALGVASKKKVKQAKHQQRVESKEPPLGMVCVAKWTLPVKSNINQNSRHESKRWSFLASSMVFTSDAVNSRGA